MPKPPVLSAASCLVVLTANLLHAQPAPAAAKPTDTPPPARSYVIKELSTTRHVDANGPTQIRRRVRVLARDAAGVQAWGTIDVPFNADREDPVLVSLTIRKPDGRTVTPANLALEDARASGSFEEPIYSSLRVKRIAVPSFEPGDTLEYEVLVTRRVPIVDGQFWFEHSFTRDAVVELETVDVDAPSGAPVIVKTRAGQGIEASTSERDGRRHWHWSHRQDAPEELNDDEQERLAREAARGRALPDPDIQLSSFRDWSTVAAWWASLADPHAQADDAIRTTARALIAGHKTAREQLSALHRFVSQRIRYVSLAFGTGQYEPRDASLVLSTNYGDCKDKHVLLAALASAVGLEVRPVLIATQRELDRDVPSPTQFDHVISVADPHDGQGLLWLDGTAAVLPAGALVLPLRNKTGLLAAAQFDGPLLITTPASLPYASHISIENTGTLDESGKMTVTVRRTLRGDEEAVLRAVLAQVPEEKLPEVCEAILEPDGFEGGKVIAARRSDPFDVDTPLSLEYEVARSIGSVARPKAWDLWLSLPRFGLPTLRDDTREPLDLLMNTGMSVHLRTTLTVPHALTVTPPIPVVVDRPFARFESKYTVAPGLLTVDRTLAIKSPQVAVDQIEAYRAFTRTLETDYGQDFAIDPMVSAGAKPAAGDAQTLAADGAKKLDARDYSAAIDLLRQAVALDPAHKSAWNNLGRALAASRQYPQAVEAYDKQLAVNPYDEYAYNNKGLALQTLGRFEEAERAFRKQIEVSPLDEHAHTNLGVMLLDRGRPAEAEAELTTASQIDPENAWVLVRLGRARLMVGHTDEAVATFDRAVVKSGSPPIWNDIAYFLAEKGVRLDRAREYAMRAVDLTLAVLKHVKVDALDNSYLGAMASIANYWDTLGWVEYRLGHLTVARDYVDASWRLAQSEVVGDHLVTLLTALDETAKAASLRELLHPGHAAAKAPLDVVDREGNLTKARTLMVPASPETPKYTGEVWIVHNGTGQVVEARPIAAGDAAGAAATALLRRVVFPPAPGDQGVMLLRQGVLACPKAGDSCSFILKRPQDVQVLTQ